jgi:hypothetical protein
VTWVAARRLVLRTGPGYRSGAAGLRRPGRHGPTVLAICLAAATAATR